MSNFDAELIFGSIPSGYVHIQCDPLHVLYLSKRAKELLCHPDSISHNEDISQLFRLEKEQSQLFTSWIKVAIRLYRIQDWAKINAIAPFQKLSFKVSENSAIISPGLRFHPFADDKKKLSGIVIEIVPEPETESIVQDSNQKVTQRENEVRAILSIANTPYDDMKEFITDTADRLKNLGTSIGELEDIYKALRADYGDQPKSSSAEISERLQSIYIDTIFRHLHTIKGNALTYEFDDLTQFAHDSESLANQLRQPVSVRRTDVIKSLKQQIECLVASFNFIISIFEKIYGNDDERTVRLPLERIETIHSLCAELEEQPMTRSIDRLVRECRTLSWKTLGSLTRKYSRVIYSRAAKLGKQIEFIVENSFTLVEPDLFKNLDDSLLQIVSNAVVHGIEDNETRIHKQKGPGHIRLTYQKNDASRVITIADDGQGIRTDLLVEQFIKKGHLTKDAAGNMNEDEKIKLIFLPRSSTASAVTTFAGRGVGLDVVDNKVKLLGGSIKVVSETGKGTKFIISIPLTAKGAGS